MKDQNYPVADVSKEMLDKIQNYEKELKKESNEEIILIAYQKERS
ncbi:hypothetical protein [Pseudalkalibacillus salsuginis]|nr:hypothetical protein [Pseudalkalibacillus salsuginis]